MVTPFDLSCSKVVIISSTSKTIPVDFPILAYASSYEDDPVVLITYLNRDGTNVRQHNFLFANRTCFDSTKINYRYQPNILEYKLLYMYRAFPQVFDYTKYIRF